MVLCAALAFSSAAFASGTAFFDDFARPDGPVGNDWNSGGLGNSSISNGMMYLRTGAVSGRDWIWRDSSSWLSGYDPNFASAGGTITWSYQFTSSRDSMGGFGNGSYAMAFVMGSSTSQVTDAGAKGYAVLVGNTGSPDPLRLQYFENGLSSEAGVPSSGSNVLASWNAGASEFNGNEAFSVRVEFVPATDTWSLYAATNGWNVPLTTADWRGSAIHEPQEELPFFDIFFNHSTGAHFSQWDQVRVAVLADEPTGVSSNLIFSDVIGTAMTLTWEPGEAAGGHLVVMRKQGAIEALPLDGVIYNAHALFGSGTPMGDNAFVVYKGTGTSVSVSGLLPATTYHAQVFDWADGGDANAINYNTNAAAGNPASQVTAGSNPDVTSTVLEPVVQIGGSDIVSLSTNPAAAVPVFAFQISDAGSGDGRPTHVTNIVIRPGANNTAPWSEALAGVVLVDANTLLDVAIGTPVIANDGITIPVPNGNLDVTDGGVREFRLKIWLNGGHVPDATLLQFSIAVAHGFAGHPLGSQFDPVLGSEIQSDPWQLVVDATQLRFVMFPTRGLFVGLPFALQVAAVDALGSVDMDPAENVTLLSTGPLSGLHGFSTVPLSGGQYTWPALACMAPGSYTLTAQAASWPDDQIELAAVQGIKPGDLAVVGLVNNNTNGPDQFVLAALDRIPANTVVYLTDNGWGSGGFRGAGPANGNGSENFSRLTTLNSIPAGMLLLSYSNTPDFVWDTAGLIPGTPNAWSSLPFSQLGDQLYLFQSTSATNPLFFTDSMRHIHTFDYTEALEDTIDSSTGTNPPGIVVGLTAISLPLANKWTLVNDGQMRKRTDWQVYIGDTNHWESGAGGPIELAPLGVHTLETAGGMLLIIQ